MENGVNIIEITLAVLIRFLSAIICCSIAIFLFLHYHSTVWIALCRFYFLSLATGMFNCWRYLATVRRAMGYPFLFQYLGQFVIGIGFLSVLVVDAFLEYFRISRTDISSPSSVTYPSLKKNFSG